MVVEKKSLEDGQYPCSATLHIKDGKAVVVLHSMFGLSPGTEIPLVREDATLLVERLDGSQVGILNGHSII